MDSSAFSSATENEELDQHGTTSLSEKEENYSEEVHSDQSISTEEEEIGLLKRELCKLRKMLQRTQDVADKWKKEEKSLLLFELQLRHLSEKRCPPEEELVYYNNKCTELRKKSSDSKAHLEMQFTNLCDQIFRIEVEMEKLQRMQKTKHLTKNRPDRMQEEKNVWLTRQLEQALTFTARQLEDKECIILEKEQQCQDMRRRLLEISQTRENIRKHNDDIASLKSHLETVKQDAFKNKEDNGKLLGKLKATKELFWEVKKKNRDVMKVLQRRGIEDDSS
ncbi:hypothetical protein JOB18_021748 [Solea senegalensis]|uniref:Uncharacterized protein n=1 Tax=Solea senegalensis TaxID=28829 RepID=A0AAV6S6K5_SOLSE|nr:hypothetical protein JOB18_021748 [Solea senegalensis]